MEQLNETQRYFIEEHVEDFRDGLISRRELIRRTTLIAGSAALATTILAACDLSPRPAATSPTTAPGASPTGTGALVAQPFATPPAAATTDGITVKPDDPRITVSLPDVKGSDGAPLMAYLAKPNVSGRVPGVIVIHENRGQTEHIRDVVRRVATAGFVALNIDLAAREGGAARLTDSAAYNAALAKRTVELKLADHNATITFLKGESSGAIGAVGFCFGGGEVWNLVGGGADIRAGVPYYGPAPRTESIVAGISKTKAAVFGVYAEQDTGITGTAPQMEAELKKTGVPFQITTYPGANHAFHNDTNAARYNAEQATKAWLATIDWFRRHLA